MQGEEASLCNGSFYKFTRDGVIVNNRSGEFPVMLAAHSFKEASLFQQANVSEWAAIVWYINLIYVF